MADKIDTINTTDATTKLETIDTTPKPVTISSPKKTKPKRLSKSKRTHIRRMKAEARREGIVYRPGIE